MTTAMHPDRLKRLQAMGIQVWQRQFVPSQTAQPAGPRIRLASGDGDWLLVQRGPWGRDYPALVADITAAIGAARCRFGQWAGSEDAGVGLHELTTVGVQHVLAFGVSPLGSGQHRGLIVAADLAELACSADAKRELWHALSEALR